MNCRLLLYLIFIGCTACVHKSLNSELQLADDLMEKHPDSALQILDSIDLQHFTREDTDYYALLFTQAKIKNNMVVSNDTLIRRARNAYKTEKNFKLNLRAFFYSSKVAFYSGDLINAMHDAIEAYEIAKSQNDLYWLAKTSELIADIFGESYNYPQAEKFTHDAIKLYSEAGYSRNKNYSICNLATYKINQEKYHTAIDLIDSLLTEVKKQSPLDTSLCEYASRTIAPALIYTEQYDRLTTEFSCFFQNVDDFDPVGYQILNSYWYNYNNDENQLRNTIYNALEYSNHNTDSIRVLYAKYRQSLDGENYKEAALLSDTLMYLQSLIATEQINESVTVEYADFYTHKSIEETIKSEKLKFAIYITGIVFVVVVILCAVAIIIREKLNKAQLEISMSEILRLTQNSSKDKMLIEKLFNDRWNYFNKICSDYFDFGATDYLKSQLLHNVESELSSIQLSITSDEFIKYVDKYLGGKLMMLKKECTFLTHHDLNLLALIGTGLSMKTISLVLGIKYKTAYQKKSRLIKKIEASEVSEQLFFWKTTN